MEIDVNNICRVCLNKGNMMSVFKVNIFKKIMSCTSVQVWPNDGLPDQICNKCVAKLHISFQFKRLCEKSDSKLRELLLRYAKQHPSDSQNTKQTPEQATEVLPPATVQNSALSINNIFIECVPMEQSSFPEDQNPLHHINFTEEANLDCPNTEDIVQAQAFDNLYQLPIQLEEAQAHQNSNSISIPQEIQAETVHIIQNLSESTERCDMKLEQTEKLTCLVDLNEKEPSDTQCKVCGKVLRSLSKLNRHMNTHSADPPFKCSICMKGFAHSGNFKVHMRMHNDERPFKCDTCGHTSRQQQDIDKHMRTHTGERPHACHFCTKAFATRSNLVAHVRTHTGERPYVCCVCQKAFCQSNELTKHMRTHTGEKSHRCDVCERGFNSASSLIAHRRTHSGDKPYVCGVCDKSYTQPYALKTHMKLHAVVHVDSKRRSQPAAEHKS